LDGAGTREGEEETRLVLLALGRPCAEGEEHGRGVSRRPRGLGQRRGAEGRRQAIGRPRHQEPQGVGQGGRRGGAVAGESTLDGLEVVCPMPTRAVEGLLHARRRGGCPGGDDQAGGGASGPPCGWEDDTPWLGPGRRGLGHRGLQTAPGGRGRGRGRRAGGLRLGPRACLLHDGCGAAASDRLACQAAEASAAVPRGAPRAHLRGGAMAVPAPQERGRGPGAPPRGEEPAPAPRLRRARGPEARAEAGRHQRAGVPGKAPERPRAIRLRSMGGDRPRLRPVGRRSGVSEGAPKGGRRRGGAGAAGGHQRLSQPREGLPGHPGCTPRAGRGTREGRRWSAGGARPAEFPQGRAPVAGGILAGRVAGGDVRAPVGPEGAQGVSKGGRLPWIVDGGREAGGQATLALDATAYADPKVRGPGSSLASGTDSMTSHGMKRQLCWSRRGHRQTSSNLCGIERSHGLFYPRLGGSGPFFMKNPG